MSNGERQSPEQLLKRAQAEERQKKRGRLKIYLGAAPGVGKTYQMLSDALQKRAKGLDVVVGVAESHGREEIEMMLKQLEILPRQVISYHEHRFHEFDLNAALKRSPGLILVDEMAHTNIPGLRHAKRWQDIKELVERGIDVYTTLNVQHVESLNNDVTQILQVPIQETVPDSMLEMADTIELIDLPPEDLLKRLQEGKVYIPQQADLASEHFFRKGNLIALRGLALRTTAERVDAEVLTYRQGEGIKQIWPTQDKILVCVSDRIESLKLIRTAKRIATSLQAEWIAAYVDEGKVSEQERNQAIRNLRFAELLGAETHVLPGIDLVHEIMSFAREKNVTQVMIWKTIRPRWIAWLVPSVSNQFVRQCGDINIYIMTIPSSEKRLFRFKRSAQLTSLKIYAMAFAIVSMVTLLNLFFVHLLPPSGLVLIYLLGIIGVSLLGRSGPSLAATLMSIVSFDVFFIKAYQNVSHERFEYILTFMVMFIVAQVLSQLIIRTRRQADAARLVQQQTSALYALSRQLTGTWSVNKLLEIGTRYIADVFNCDAIALLPKRHGRLELFRPAHSPPKKLETKERSIAAWVFGSGKMAGLGTDTLAFSEALYLPLLVSQGVLGVLRIRPKEQQLLTPEQMRLLESCVNQLALALEVGRLQEKTTRREMQQESERVQSTLLEAIGKTIQLPLSHILGAANHLKTRQATKDYVEQNVFIQIEQLKRLGTNIARIATLEEQADVLKKSSCSIEETLNDVLKKHDKLLINRQIHVNMTPLPPVLLDKNLLEEVLSNLLDNAIKFSPATSPIDISASREDHHVLIRVEDRGDGILINEIPRLFEKFYRGQHGREERGLGLGLAICQKIIKVHGGEIWAENRTHGGASFSFTLPCGEV